MLDALHAHPPQDADELIGQTLQTTDPNIRTAAAQLAGALGHPGFARAIRDHPPDAGQIDHTARVRALALGVAMHPDPAGLQPIVAARVASWQEREAARHDRYTAGKGFSLAAPEIPLLRKNVLLHRLAYLAYLSRREPDRYARPLAREWVKAVGVLDEVAGELSFGRAAVALAWLMRHPSGIVPIVGSTQPERIAQAAHADSLQLDREQWYRIYAAVGGRLP